MKQNDKGSVDDMSKSPWGKKGKGKGKGKGGKGKGKGGDVQADLSDLNGISKSLWNSS